MLNQAILVIRHNNDDDKSRQTVTRELFELCKTAGYKVLAFLEQERERDPRFEIGKGKLEELKDILKEREVETIIFGNYLTSKQILNLEQFLSCKVIDKYMLILEIFEIHASDHVSKLQIEIARKKHLLPIFKEFVKRRRMGERTGFSGLGHYEIDIYGRSVRKQIARLQKKLEEIKKKRRSLENLRRDRGINKICLVGYTNAGKSTLLNSLADCETRVGDEFFTTLDTFTRPIKVDGRKVLCTDSIGFIHDLPPELIESFTATLEATLNADLLVIVVDVSDPLNEIKEKVDTCIKILVNIGAGNIPKIITLNKTDLVPNEKVEKAIIMLKNYGCKVVSISAKTGENFDVFSRNIAEILPPYKKMMVRIPLNSPLSSYAIHRIYTLSLVKNRKIENCETVFELELAEHPVAEIRKLVEKCGGTSIIELR
ncbi:MAG: GTPase HflX [Candidatus Wukongarchaeota archaeon]|nr:GTPase HflX [Candidatus Wukongarchaeota archaeon]